MDFFCHLLAIFEDNSLYARIKGVPPWAILSTSHKWNHNFTGVRICPNTSNLMYIKYVQVLHINYSLIKPLKKKKKKNSLAPRHLFWLTLSRSCPWDLTWGGKKNKGLSLQGYSKTNSLATDSPHGISLSLLSPNLLSHLADKSPWLVPASSNTLMF